MCVRANERGRERERECSLGLRGFFFVFPFCAGSGPRARGFAQARARGQDQTVSKIVLRYPKYNTKYSVQGVALLKGRQCQKYSFATRKIMQNIAFKGLLWREERNVKNVPSLRAR